MSLVVLPADREPSATSAVIVEDSQSAESGYSGTRATCVGNAGKELVSEGLANGGETVAEQAVVSGWKRSWEYELSL